MSTIFALATAQGRAGVSVVRVSGPLAFDIAQRFCGDVPAPRMAAVRRVSSDTSGVIDDALVLTFKGPHSFTGEDVVEFHLHGSTAVVSAVLSSLSAVEGASLAEPGEFTRRALENGKLDLAQVEGLADLIEAETEAQRRQALRVLSGDLGKRVEAWRSKLIRAASLLEATIDFADEDVPVDVTPEVSALLGEVLDDVNAEIDGSYVAERVRLGFEVAIIGPPNVGKSTLLNTLSGRDAAITSDVAGTTRDVIEVRMDLLGLPVTLLDTAGLRDSDDTVEAIGIERAMKRADTADVRVFLVEGAATLGLQVQEGDVVLRPKVDEPDGKSNGISGKTGYGVSELLDNLHNTLSQRSASAGLATHERHRNAMVNARQYLVSAIEQAAVGPEVYDIAAEDMRSAIRALETLVGRIDVEALLDEIFASFCLGK